MPNSALHLFFAALTFHWTPQVSNTTSSLRGLSVVSENVVWASGSKGTILRTLDAGAHWELRSVKGGQSLDFRDIVAFDANSALTMSSGTGADARVYLTRDGGTTWKLVLPNPDKTGFFDAMKFWDRKHGILLGDPVEGRFTIFVTNDGGQTWGKAAQPPALKDEGAFAASGTCLALFGRRDAWFGSGGPGGGRVFHTSNRGNSWTIAATPLTGQTAASGIFSVKFIDASHGLAVGGDYQKPDSTDRTIAITNDGGKNWTTPQVALMGGFRSAITYLKRERILIAVGTSGSDFSSDGGQTWASISKDSLNAVAHYENHLWAVGPKGVIFKLTFSQ